jgi:hypothetical protein
LKNASQTLISLQENQIYQKCLVVKEEIKKVEQIKRKVADIMRGEAQGQKKEKTNCGKRRQRAEIYFLLQNSNQISYNSYNLLELRSSTDFHMQFVVIGMGSKSMSFTKPNRTGRLYEKWLLGLLMQSQYMPSLFFLNVSAK